MHEPNLVLLFTAPLERANIDYMVTGSVAGMIYGEPRVTHDVDLVVALTADSAMSLATHFPEEEFYCPPPEYVIGMPR